MPGKRGDYRAVYEVLWDGPDFQRLPPDARLVLLALKLRGCGRLGIRAIPGLIGALTDWTGMPSDRVSDGIKILSEMGWVKVEGSLVWVIRGLEFETQISPNNPNHVASLMSEVNALPRKEIVAEFCRYYTPSWPCLIRWHRNGTEIPSSRDGDGSEVGISTLPIPITLTQTLPAAVAASPPAPAPAPEGGGGSDGLFGVSSLLDRFAEPLHRQAVEGALRSARNPNALAAELLARIHAVPGHDPATPEEIGQALHDMAVAGAGMSARTLTRFVDGLREGNHREGAPGSFAAWKPPELR